MRRGADDAQKPIPAAIWIVAASAIAVRILLALLTRYTSEDYMITLRYAENLANGHGMVYNLGERSLGTTTPLYTLFLALTSWLSLSPTLCGKAVNILADGALCLMLYLWLRRLGYETAGRLAALCAAAHPLHFQWAISGMETSLVTTVGVWAWYAAARRNYMEAYAALGILFLLRWDSLLMATILTGAILIRERRLIIREICLFAFIVAPWLLAATLYYGSPIPVTGQAKIITYGWFADHWLESTLRYDTTQHGQWPTTLVQQEPTRLLRRLPRQQKLLNFFLGSPAQALLTLAAIGGLYRMVRDRRYALVAPIAWTAAYLLAFLASRILLFNWYMVPPFPIVEALAAIGIAPLAHVLTRRMPRPTAAAAYYACLVAAAAGSALPMYPILRQSQMIEENARIPIGQWLNQNSGASDRILLEPIGYIGYYARRRIIDVIGLVTPDVLRFYTPSAHSPWLGQIREYRPEWCVLRPTELQEIEHAAILDEYPWRSRYSLAKTVAYTPRPNEKPLVFYIFKRQDLHPRSENRLP